MLSYRPSATFSAIFVITKEMGENRKMQFAKAVLLFWTNAGLEGKGIKIVIRDINSWLDAYKVNTKKNKKKHEYKRNLTAGKVTHRL